MALQWNCYVSGELGDKSYYNFGSSYVDIFFNGTAYCYVDFAGDRFALFCDECLI
jgi:hypothetical protein